ncbi:hypothetical protein [Niallia sp. Krafla_26]|uniref:hypothetical protein n=1 Tax=Niallia sp. Krafla_26 TaxID=3064703 RepID=UPI003D1865AD
MKFADHLSKEDIRKFNQMRKAERDKKLQKPRKKEKLSQRELEDLMDVHRDVYIRHNGAWRRK